MPAGDQAPGAEAGRAGPSTVVHEDINRILHACEPELAELAGSTVLISGANGFAGSYLVETIAAWNAIQPRPVRLLLPVRSLSRARQRLPHLAGVPEVNWIAWPAQGDLRELIGEGADYVIHGASPVDPARYMQAPHDTLLAIADLTRQMIAYAEAAGARRLLYLSSGAVYGPQPPDLAGFKEDYPGGPELGEPRSCYAEGKRYAELLCLTSRVETVVARIFAVLGPYQDLSASFAVPDFICQATRSGRIRLRSDGRALRTYCYASDLASSLWKLLLRGEAGASYNVGAAGPVVSIRDVAEAVAARLGETAIEVPESAGQGLPPRYTPDVTKLARLFAPSVAFGEGLERMLAFLRQQEPDPTRWN